jgi:prepilin-type processing-associated H-X9-DG protein
LNAYLSDHDMRMPSLAAARSSKSEEVPVIDTLLAEYVSDKRVFRCPADRTLAEQTGTSYFYNSALSGQAVAALNFLGVSDAPTRIPVLVDKEGWHKHSENRVNHLFADGHAGSEFRLFAE